MINTKRRGRFSRPSNNDNLNSSLDRLRSFYRDTDWKSSLLDWGKPLFSQHGGSLERVLTHAGKTAERSRRFLNRIESKKQSSIMRSKSVPKNATIRQEYIKCGKTPCYHEKHGPYYYAYWKDPETKKLRKKYIGTHMPETAKG